jgi:hypothetical protein
VEQAGPAQPPSLLSPRPANIVQTEVPDLLATDAVLTDGSTCIVRLAQW